MFSPRGVAKGAPIAKSFTIKYIEWKAKDNFNKVLSLQ